MRQSWWSGGKGESGFLLGPTPDPGRMPAGATGRSRRRALQGSGGLWKRAPGGLPGNWRNADQRDPARRGRTDIVLRSAGVACQPRGMLVLLRNTTPLRDAEDGLSRATEKSDHLHEMLEAESFIRAEEEKIIKSSFEKLADLKEDTINAVTSIVRKKDPDTARHQERVSHLACAMGQEMGLDKDTVSMVALAALLHDLGKVFVSSSTLLKPGRLTPAEMEEVRKHADTEFEILKGVQVPQPDGGDIDHDERLDVLVPAGAHGQCHSARGTDPLPWPTWLKP